jgi:hypothetical protein
MPDPVIRIVDSNKGVFVAIGNAGVTPGTPTQQQGSQTYPITRESLTDGKVVFPFVKDGETDSPSVFVYNNLGVMVWASDVTFQDPNLVVIDLTGYELTGTWLIRIA